MDADEVVSGVDLLRSVVKEEIDRAEAFRRRCRSLGWANRKEFRQILLDVLGNADHLVEISVSVVRSLCKSKAANFTRAQSAEVRGELSQK